MKQEFSFQTILILWTLKKNHCLFQLVKEKRGRDKLYLYLPYWRSSNNNANIEASNLHLQIPF